MSTTPFALAIRLLRQDRAALMVCHALPPDYAQIAPEESAALEVVADYNEAIDALEALENAYAATLASKGARP